ncbi:hypothetical protein BST61_g6122 [Cercospora zeina]
MLRSTLAFHRGLRGSRQRDPPAVLSLCSYVSRMQARYVASDTSAASTEPPLQNRSAYLPRAGNGQYTRR